MIERDYKRFILQDRGKGILAVKHFERVQCDSRDCLGVDPASDMVVDLLACSIERRQIQPAPNAPIQARMTCTKQDDGSICFCLRAA